MCNERLGKTIIDALTICYIAGEPLLDALREVNYRIEFDSFILHRSIGRTHHQHFDVVLHGDKIACIYFDRYGTGGNEPYAWLRIENYVLYNSTLLVKVLTLPQLLDLSFNNLTHLDLAKDFKYNICDRIRALMRNPKLKTIINGKHIKNRDNALQGVTRTCKISLNRDKSKSLTIKQAKAIKNKYNGITLDSYDKYDEIQSKSSKQYILDFYSNPKRLYRLEMRLNNEDIKKISECVGVVITEDIIYDTNRLDTLYLYALQSLIRFTDGRRKILWKELFDNNVRYI